jgi:hypothetical protein
MCYWVCNYELLLPLEPLLAHPSPSAAAATTPVVSPTLLTSIVVVVAVVVLIAHRMPLLQAPLLASAKRAWRVVAPLALAADDPELVNVATLHLHFRLCPLLHLLSQ